MSRVIIKKSLTTEKSYHGQDVGHWTFVVAKDANKSEIKSEIERLFSVEVDKVQTLLQRPKVRQLRGNRAHTKRHIQKIARVSLKDKTKKIDLTKTKK